MREKDDGTLPFTRIESVITDSTQLSASEKLLYGTIKAYRNNRTGQCNPSLKTLCRGARLSKPTVLKARRGLKKLGLIDWQRGGQGSCRYLLLLEENSLKENLPTLKQLKRKEGPSLLGNWFENVEGDVSNGQNIDLKEFSSKDKILAANGEDFGLNNGQDINHELEEVTKRKNKSMADDRHTTLKGGGLTASEKKLPTKKEIAELENDLSYDEWKRQGKWEC